MLSSQIQEQEAQYETSAKKIFTNNYIARITGIWPEMAKDMDLGMIQLNQSSLKGISYNSC
jgi:hypothetical protein